MNIRIGFICRVVCWLPFIQQVALFFVIPIACFFVSALRSFLIWKMMDRELSYFSRLAGMPHGNAADTLTEEDVTASRLQWEALRVRQKIVARMGAFCDAPEGRLYIGGITAGITALLDLADSLEVTGTAAAIRERMAPLLEGLLSFIQRYYRTYMDMGSGLPRRQAEAFVRDSARRIAQLRKQLDESGATDPVLRLLLIQALKRYVMRDGTQTPVSFGDAGYFEHCIHTLSDFVKEGQDDADARLLRLLYSLDFNEAHVVAYFVSWLQRIADATEDTHERIACLRRLLKDFRQMTVIPGALFCPDGEGLRTTVNRWLEEELWYYSEQVSSSPVTSAGSATEPVRIKTGLTVAQHACLLKLMLEGGVIVHRNHSDVIRWWAGSVGTSRSEALSERSFRSKFSSVDRDTADAVRSVLLNLVQLSRRV